MSNFITHTEESAPQAAKSIFTEAEKAYGMLPNLHRKMAESPALLKGYWQLSLIFSNSSLTPVEQQVVLIAASVVNNCAYCVGAHSVLADMVNTPKDVTQALRDDEVVPDARLQALRKFTQSVVVSRGLLDEKQIHALLDEGFSKEQVLEVILGIGLKTLSNYTNHLVHTELDQAFQVREWKRKQTA